MEFFGLVFLAIIVEGVISYIRTFFVEGKPQWQMLAGIALGVLVTVTYRVDVFELVGLPAAIPYVGMALTGILISRGSNYVFDLVKKLTDTNSKAGVSK